MTYSPERSRLTSWRRQGAILSAVLCFGTVASADVMKTHPEDDLDCIPDAEFEFGGIRMDMPEQDVLSTIGAPNAKTPPAPLDDIPFDYKLSYDGLSVWIFQGIVVDMDATDAGWQTPSGLRVGLSRGELTSILGRLPEPSPYYEDGRLSDIYQCNGGELFDLGFFLRIEMTADDTVGRLSMLRDWP